MTKRIETILVPVDFGAPSEHALEYAVTLSEQLDAKVHVMSSYELPIGVFPEGTRSRCELLRARSGVGRLALEVPEAHVTLVAIEGTSDLTGFPRRQRITSLRQRNRRCHQPGGCPQLLAGDDVAVISNEVPLKRTRQLARNINGIQAGAGHQQQERQNTEIKTRPQHDDPSAQSHGLGGKRSDHSNPSF